MEALRYRTPLWTHKVALCLCAVLCATPGAKGGVSHAHSSLTASAPHQQYICPLGATVKLVCSQTGALLNSKDVLRDSWLFTPNIDQQCGTQHPRGHSPGSHSLPPGMHVHASKHNFWLTLENVTFADQGRYCCRFQEVEKGHSHQVKQDTHAHIVVTITPRKDGSQNCTVWDSTPSGGGSLAVALAIAACILALLALPLILVLVYKQRHGGHSSRRGQELVRMDSEAQGHENPVFLGGSPQTKTRTVSQIMTRQSSEVGRHLLSEPGTPLSPPAHGDVFFPSEDTIPESPNVLQA